MSVDKRNIRLRPGSAASQGDDLAREVRPHNRRNIFLAKFSTCQYSHNSLKLCVSKHCLTNNEQIGGAPVSYPEQWWAAKEEIPILG